ncbi:hypothetical protein BHF70_05595 [Anaerostipes sp. 494a]|nr:hypothetical protein BHF70_05595 [Anaerostipes sp. 494a]
MMKKTLYISDLDGTLLGSNEFLSPFAVDTINQLIHEGAIISIATARNLTSATPRIKDLNFQIPIILNNGVAMYNWQTRHYTYVAELAASDIDIMGQILREEKCTGYMYALNNEEICMFHNPLYTPEDQAYFNKRRSRYEGRIIDMPQFSAPDSQYTPFYCVVFGLEEKVKRVQARINSTAENIYGVLNKNVYADDYFLDVFNSSVSKASTIKMLADQLDVDEIVAFGDNYNDLEMLQAADRSYVPANALPEIMEYADGILESCENDGVPKFIFEDFHKNF